MSVWPGYEGSNTKSQETDKNTPEKLSINAHERSDLDASPVAQHHTLGISSFQASPGNHNHDGKNSRKLKVNASDIVGLEAVVLNIINNNSAAISNAVSDARILAAIQAHPSSVAGYIRSNMLAVYFSGSRNTDSWRQLVMQAFVALGCTDATSS